MNAFVNFRCTDRLADLIAREADALGLTRSQYIRAVLWRSVGSGIVRNAISDMHLRKMDDDCEVICCEDEQTYQHNIF